MGRPDGKPVPGLSPMRRMVPYLMTTRNGAIVYFDQRLEVTKTLAFCEEHEEVNLFKVVLAALVRTFVERPQLNRFVAGKRIYQRDDLSISFAVKKQYSDAARLTAVKVVFDEGDDLFAVARRIDEIKTVGKGSADTTSEKEMSVLTRLPAPVLGALLGVQRRLDGVGLWPGSMIRPDPMYASVFVTNLGSIGIDAAYHHLYEYGTVSFFAALGKVHKAPVVGPDEALAVGQVAELRFAFDERITDGFYCARSLELFQRYVEDPATLVGATGS